MNRPEPPEMCGETATTSPTTFDYVCVLEKGHTPSANHVFVRPARLPRSTPVIPGSRPTTVEGATLSGTLTQAGLDIARLVGQAEKEIRLGY